MEGAAATLAAEEAVTRAGAITCTYTLVEMHDHAPDSPPPEPRPRLRNAPIPPSPAPPVRPTQPCLHAVALIANGCCCATPGCPQGYRVLVPVHAGRTSTPRTYGRRATAFPAMPGRGYMGQVGEGARDTQPLATADRELRGVAGAGSALGDVGRAECSGG